MDRCGLLQDWLGTERSRQANDGWLRLAAVLRDEGARFVAERGIDVDHLFTQRYTSLDEAEDAYRLFDTQTTGKGVFLL